MSKNVSPTCLPPNEIAMQQIWRFKLWRGPRPRTVDGEAVEIIDPGALNTGPGPDFSNARIRVGEHIWAGSVELHVRASDWHRHGHDDDPAYDNVVLHVVGLSDALIKHRDGTIVPQIVMCVGDQFVRTFNHLIHGTRLVLPACGDKLENIASLFVTDWITALGFERLHRKVADIDALMAQHSGDHLSTVYITLARALGFNTNAQTMESLARSVPVRTLLKHIDSPTIIEAILLGQAGLINIDHPADEMEESMARDYAFLARKYDLTPLERPIWHPAGRNAAASPHRRIALLASILSHHAHKLGQSLAETTSIQAVRNLFSCQVSPYWMRHSTFGQPLPAPTRPLGQANIDVLIINLMAPLIYQFGASRSRYDLIDAAIALLEDLKAESNSIIRGFEAFGIKARDAFTSQALIQLHRQYCEQRRCLDCRIGCRLLAEHTSLL